MFRIVAVAVGAAIVAATFTLVSPANASSEGSAPVWQPKWGAFPNGQPYFYLKGEPTEPMSDGIPFLYGDRQFSVLAVGDNLYVSSSEWNVELDTPTGSGLSAGWWDGAVDGGLFPDPGAAPRMKVSRDMNPCEGPVGGWFSIDAIGRTPDGGNLVNLPAPARTGVFTLEGRSSI